MDWSSLRNAVIVCGHAVYHGGPRLDPSDVEKDAHWHLQSFQSNEGKFYVEHIRRGVTLAAEDTSSLLIFSGGQTRAPHVLSEAQGYHHVAQALHFWGASDVRFRTTTEEFSRDSHDNVLFGIARFTEAVGHIPRNIYVLTWKFKEPRVRHHIWSLRWPLDRFSFVGVGNPQELEKAKTAEAKTLASFAVDPSGYGVDGGELGKKKAARNPYKRQHGYSVSCPEMAKILAWRGPTRLPESDIPWSR